jgi:hypothetical protein
MVTQKLLRRAITWFRNDQLHQAAAVIIMRQNVLQFLVPLLSIQFFLHSNDLLSMLFAHEEKLLYVSHTAIFSFNRNEYQKH